ncbi:MAG: hypothetical protein J6L84_00715 [Clostridiales bacterium]|nr:hypothetical protein [Clostridiales bacterium]MBP3810050.1 hypothetical protein [Clostridiales bacterium]
MNTKKFVSAVTAASVLALSFTGCSLLGGKDKEAIEEVATSYIDYIKDGKLNKSAALVVDEEDYFQENAFPVQQEDLLNAVLASTEFTVENIEVKKDSGSADIVFTMPDLESIADEGYSFDEFLDAIGDIDDTVEETVEFEFSKDGEDWLIEGDSTEDLFNFFMSIGEGIEFAGLSESAALEAVDTFMSYLAQGDVQGVLAMSPEGADIFENFDEISDALGADNTVYSDLFSTYFSQVDYESSISSVSEDAIVVSLTGTAPDAEPAITAAVQDHDVMVPIFADYIESLLNNSFDINTLMVEILDAVNTAVGQTTLTTAYNASVTVTADDDGNLYVDPDDQGFFYDFDFPELADSNELMVEALDLLLEQGRISQSDYNSYMTSLGGTPAAGDYDVTEVPVIEGDDLYSYDYTVADDMIYVNVRTWAYYNTGDTFGYDVEINGEDAFSGHYEMPDDYDDMIYITIPVDDPAGPSGSYVVTVYDEGSTSSVLIKLELVVITEGAPVPAGSAPVFGESMSYGNEGDDFYTFRFTDGNGEYFTDSEYPSNRGAVDFFVMTWAYYDVGTGVDCDVYCDGEYVDTITAFNRAGATDTFEFSYEPSSLEDGDYVFRIHDVEGNGILCDAYCTVVTDN